jgi:hypothetical protein
MSDEPITQVVDMPAGGVSENDVILQRLRNDVVLRLFERWMTDESGYDEEVWPIVRQTIEEHRSSYRRRFDD